MEGSGYHVHYIENEACFHRIAVSCTSINFQRFPPLPAGDFAGFIVGVFAEVEEGLVAAVSNGIDTEESFRDDCMVMPLLLLVLLLMLLFVDIRPMVDVEVGVVTDVTLLVLIVMVCGGDGVVAVMVDPPGVLPYLSLVIIVYN